VKVVQYLQVLLLLSLAGYLLLLGLENPVSLRLPLWNGAALELPAWQVVGGSLLAGAAYAALLFTPPALRRALRIQRERSRRKDLEHRLSSTVQARLAEADVADKGVAGKRPRVMLRLGRRRDKQAD